MSVDATSRFAGGDVNFLYNLYRASALDDQPPRLKLSLPRSLDESLSITANSTVFATTTYTDNMGNVLASAPPGSSITVYDHFGTRSQFNGGQLGAEFQYLQNRWYIGGAVKLAIGATHEVVSIDGSTTVYPTSGAPIPLSGGNFATLQTGRYATNRFAVAPEAQLNIGYQITPSIRAMIGYNFLYLTSVARPA